MEGLPGLVSSPRLTILSGTPLVRLPCPPSPRPYACLAPGAPAETVGQVPVAGVAACLLDTFDAADDLTRGVFSR